MMSILFKKTWIFIVRIFSTICTLWYSFCVSLVLEIWALINRVRTFIFRVWLFLLLHHFYLSFGLDILSSKSRKCMTLWGFQSPHLNHLVLFLCERIYERIQGWNPLISNCKIITIECWHKKWVLWTQIHYNGED